METKGGEMTFRDAKVGDRVWSAKGTSVCVGGTNGTITSINHGLKTPIYVVFDGTLVVETFTVGGRFSALDSEPSLYWTRPVITGGDVPPVRETRVVVRKTLSIDFEGSFLSCSDPGQRDKLVISLPEKSLKTLSRNLPAEMVAGKITIEWREE